MKNESALQSLLIGMFVVLVLAASSSSAAPKRAGTQPSPQIEFAASRAQVDGREVAGFIARQPSDAQEENVNAPAGLKPLEQEAWLAMARRQRTSSHGMELTSFYPERSGDPFVVECQGVRVAVRPLGSSDVAAQLQDSQVIYSNAYELTDSIHAVKTGGRSEEFLFLKNECAPHQFEYEVSELSAGVRMELVGGEVRFRTESGRGMKIEAPWVMDAQGERRTGVVRWELQERKGETKPLLRLVLAEGLSYPLVIDPSWATTGNLATARSHHTATLLPSGKVLVAGGFNENCSENCGALSSAELYDPATGLWSPTGGLATERWLHTATLLPSGKVLVAGGYNTSIGGLNSAELYDPASGNWSATGSLWAAHDGHTATLLPSGKVLVAGGTSYSAELYDPASGLWTRTGFLVTARATHTATLLPSGKVLVAGGGGDNGYLNSAELYDPATGSWNATGSLATARTQHTATLLPSGKVLVAGGNTQGLAFSSSELYDPASGLWSATGSLATERCVHTATLLPSGKVLAAGGFSNSGDLNSAELYDPASGLWSATTSMATARELHTATLLPNGKVLVAAGTHLRSAELYEPAAADPTPTPSPTPTATATATATSTGTPQPTPTPQCPRWSFTVALPVTTIAPSPSSVVLIPVTSSHIDTGGVNLSGFQGDFTFDSSVITFSSPFVQRGGLTSDPIWNVQANVIGTSQIRTLRISAFQTQFRPLVGGPDTLFYLRVQARTSTLGSSTPLTWAPACPDGINEGNEFLYIDENLNAYDVTQTNGVITIQAPITISGTISYCSNSVPGPVPGVTLNVTGSASGSTSSDSSGNYLFSGLPGGATYTVTPTKAPLAPGSSGINTMDVLAAQRHFLGVTPLTGCRLTAADVNADGQVDTRDVTAIVRFYLGQTSGIGNVGKYQFNPTNRAYSSVTVNQTGQNYDTLIFGDVASAFADRPGGPSQDGGSGGEIPSTVEVVALPEITVAQAKSDFVAGVTTTTIDAKNRLVGFQGDFTFDGRTVSFESEPVQNAGLTAGNWSVSANVLPGKGPIRTLRVSAFSNDFTPLSGSGTLFELKMLRISNAAQSTPLLWAAGEDQFIFIDADLNMQKPISAAPGSITTSGKCR